MAQIRKRGQTWTYVVDLGIDPLTKKRLQVSKGGFSSQREAKAAARIVEFEKEQGTFIKEADIPFEVFANDWLKIYSRSGVKVSSVRAEKKK
jgi:hypothetical protein